MTDETNRDNARRERLWGDHDLEVAVREANDTDEVEAPAYCDYCGFPVTIAVVITRQQSLRCWRCGRTTVFGGLPA